MRPLAGGSLWWYGAASETAENRGAWRNNMRKLVTSTFVTLDGVMQAPGGPEEDESGGFKWGGWSVNYWDDVLAQAMGEVFAKRPELLLGRKTYEIFAAYWPNAKDEPGA